MILPPPLRSARNTIEDCIKMTNSRLGRIHIKAALETVSNCFIVLGRLGSP